MPEVKVYYKGGVPPSILEHLCKVVLPEEVADALDVPEMPEARLVSGDVEVRAYQVGPFDVQDVDVAVVVEANDYPPRKAKLEIAEKQIREEVDRALNEGATKKITSNVWVRVAPGAFGESK